MIEGTNLRCGYVTVAEDHSNPTGKTIQLAVAIFTSPSPDPASIPLISLQGGPGGAWLSVLGPAINSESAPALVGDRDLILVDQRGTGFSRPRLTCPRQVPPTASEDVGQNESVAYFTACRNYLDDQGIDLNAYNTTQNAADINDVRMALGYKQVDLYGVSYGTVLVQAILRAYGSSIRSAILDAVQPIQGNLVESGLIMPSRGIEALVKGCAANAACNRAYPRLGETFYRLVASLNARPLILRFTNPATGQAQQDQLTGAGFANVIFHAQYQTELIPHLPLVIAATAAGQYQPLSQLMGPAGEVDEVSSVALGMYYSVVCSEDAPFTSAAELTAAAAALRPEIRQSKLASALNTLKICAAWDVNEAPADFSEPVTSSVPTLLLSGQYDPITPPSNATEVTHMLDRAVHFEFPGYGHGVKLSSACANGVAQAFLARPGASPDSSCLVNERGARFTVPTPSGSTG
jgi:pimeloyl-ACP methyl ester carboxylesterase